MAFPKLPYALGTLLNYSDLTFRFGKTILPAKLPFPLNINEPISERIYGSKGYELVCRSYVDYQNVLLRTNDVTSLTYSVEMDGPGVGTVSLNIDEFNTKLLESGHEAQVLTDEENLWELYFDGNLWFNWFGQSVKDIDVADNEVKSISVSGPGVAETLKWAMVLPNSFKLNNPLFIGKLEDFTDDSSGDRLNTQTWNKSSADNVVISGSSARQDAESEIEYFSGELKEITQDIIDATKEAKDAKVEYDLAVADDTKTDAERNTALNTFKSKKQQQKNLMNAVAAGQGTAGSKKRQLADANASVASALAFYNSKAKDSLASEADKKAAYQAMVDQQKLLEKLQDELDFNINHLEGARDKLKRALPDAFDGPTRLRLSLPGIGSSKVIAAGPFDFTDSGISAVVEPVPMSYTAGQAFTYFKVAYNEQNYVALFTEHTGIMRIRAEICNNEESNVLGYEYQPKNMAYWRIREDDSIVTLEVSGDGVKWNDLNKGKIEWPTGEVTFSFSANLTGFVGIEPPLAAYISQINEVDIPPAKTPVEKLLKYIKQAQARNVIPMVTTDFTAAVDSYGATWNTNAANVEFEDGSNLYSVTESAAQAHSANWIMTPDFKLHLYQYDYPSNIPDPTVSFHKEDKVIFHTGGSIKYKERNRVRDAIANYIVGRAADGSAAVAENVASQVRYHKRELFISATNVKNVTELGKMVNTYLAQTKDEKSSWRVSVDPHLENRRVFKDYGVGSWIAIESVDQNGKVTKDVWRVLAISGSISAQGDEAVELTLQSRIDIFLEKVKRQLERMSTGSASSGSSALVSGAVAAAVVSGGALEDLENVVVQDPKIGDVLTWTGSYATFVKPGDKTIPSPPAILSSLSNVYYPGDDTTTRAQLELKWDVPKNTDGSTVTDGHHYEVRYRPFETLPYQVNWNSAQQTSWNQLHQWEQPTTPPLNNTGWQTVYVPWGDNDVIIQELTPGVKYSIQIRAVDISSPQNFSDWSVEVQHTVAQDNLAPPQPAAPLVYASRISVQVVHNLGMQSGGTFNLPSDMDHLEVHVGPDAGFVPNDKTKKGKINAVAGIIKAKTPVVSTFQIDETSTVWVRVVAVDKTGNKSSPSPAATATANLIDNAHISDLTVSKITAGELSANVILSSSIKTAAVGARAEMNNEGFQTYAEDGTQTISLAGDPEAFDPGISFTSVGAVVAGTTSLSPALPAGGDSSSLNLLVLTTKPASVDVTTPAGWDLVDYATNGEEIAAEDLGSVRVTVFSQVGNAAGTVAVSIPSATTSAAYIERWSKTSAGSWNVEQYSKSGDASDGQNFFAFGDAALSLRDNDYLTGFVGVNSDGGTLTYLGFSAGGVNIVNAALRVNTPYTAGDDGRVIAFDGKVFDGYSFEPPYVVYENTASQSGTVFLLRLSVNDLTSTNFVSIKNRGKTVASIDRDGRGSFQELTISGNMYFQGKDLAVTLAEKPIGAVAYGESSVEVVGAGAALSRGWMELAFEAEAGRRYSVNVLVAAKSDTANDSMLFVVRDGLEGDPAEPFPASVYLAEARSPFSPTANNVTIVAAEIFLPELTTGTHRLLLLFRGVAGLATINPTSPASFLGGAGTSKMWVEDKGLTLSSVGVLNDGNIPASGGSSSTAPKPGAAKPKTRKTYRYPVTWSGTYRENNGYSPSRGSQMQQGDLGDAYHGNAKALMGFDSAKIISDLAGATIVSCKITMYANHWWNNSGGTAKIGTHNYTSRPQTWASNRVRGSRVLKGNWPKPGQRTVDLGTTIGNDFKSGVARGLTLGPATTVKEFAGRFNGFGMDKAPVLEIIVIR